MPELWAIPATRLILVEGDPGIPAGQEDDWAAGLGGLLHEGKAIGTAQLKANVGERDLSMAFTDANAVRQAIRQGSTNAGAALQPVYSSFNAGLTQIVNGLTAGDISRRDARLSTASLLRTTYENIREIARRASGMPTLAHESTIYREEERWFRSAVNEEVSYLHGFLDDIIGGRTQRIQERISAYTAALRFMYEAARIQALPNQVLLYWTGPRKRDDPKVCEGCEYMMERSPFPKDTIPAVPRDGSTPCLTNCRHRIIVRVVEDTNAIVRRRATLGRRESMLRRLNEIKESAGLGRAAPRRSRAERNPFSGTPLTRARASRVRRRR